MSNVSVAEARERFSEIIALVAYKGERFVVERKGKPMAALVSLEDLALLEQTENSRTGRRGRRLAALEHSAAIREEILTARSGKLLPDSADTINEMREDSVGQ